MNVYVCFYLIMFYMQWGLFVFVMFFLGGVGLFVFVGGVEIFGELEFVWQVVVVFLVGVGVLVFFLLFYVLNWWVVCVWVVRVVNFFLELRCGGFWKGVLMGMLVVVVVQIGSIGVGIFCFGLIELECNFFVFVLLLVLVVFYIVFLIVLLVGGLIGCVWCVISLQGGL